jgi:hypothetical protein
MQLTTTRKVMATGAALLGVLLGAAGISAAATSGGSTHRSPAAAHAQSSTGAGKDIPEADDVPDANDPADAGEADGQG